ncbi:ROK family protein [Martelella alba]|uniref:ROK family protein n=1 Tax=Martelella alba TaxID=2590451 RepID=A0A506U1M2_9HYPH|nr:ROK family protein [Martelella alba]TPW28273.1 ROK family protein [Martelella alba]
MTVDFCVDIGGTKIQYCLIDEDNHVLPLGRTPTALMRRGTKAFAQDLASLIEAVCPPGVARVGVSLNGILDRGHVVYSSLMGGLVDFPLQAYLAERLKKTVHADDDLHAMGIAEARLVEASRDRPVALLNIGTGIGIGFYDGAVLRGSYAAGLISEQPVYVEELGEYRSLDRTVCGRGMREIYEKLCEDRAEAVTIFARARLGEAAAQKTVRIFARYLGETMQMISRFYHPERIAINGSIKHAASDFLGPASDVYHDGLSKPFVAEIAISPLDHAAERGVILGLKEREEAF